MRDPERIPKVLAEIERQWRKMPDLRLCQLIVNVAGIDPFYVEDDRLIELSQPQESSPAPAGTEEAHD